VPEQGEWGKLFSAAFVQSRNAMVLLDSRRRVVDVNGAFLKLMGYRRQRVVDRVISEFVVDGPIATEARWRALVHSGQFTGEAEMIAADGSRVGVQWAATAEVVTGRKLVLFVALTTSRWGPRFRREVPDGHEQGALSAREREIVRLVALGNSGPEIAEELRIAHDTVRTHARNAMTKVGARSRAHLVAKALAEGLVLGEVLDVAAPEIASQRPARPSARAGARLRDRGPSPSPARTRRP